MARRQFLDGTIKVSDLSKVTGLRITPVTAGTSGRASVVHPGRGARDREALLLRPGCAL